ncbi:MAG: ribosome-associated translation inhibitor RaiA [Candidatus Saccharimonadales bacterium]
MIESIDITGIKYDIDATTKKYVMKKIGRLDRYLPRHARKTASADVRLRMGSGKNGNKYEVEVTLNVPDKVLTATDSTVNMLAAVDIVESKLVAQLHRYKTASIPHIGRRGVLSRFKRSYDREKQ